MSDSVFDGATVTIVGAGLLGTSLGLALKARAGVAKVIGVSRSEEGLRTAADRGAIDGIVTNVADAAALTDVLVLCTPVGVMGTLMRDAGPALPDHATVTDVGSTKALVVRDVCEAWTGAGRFVGAHPIAGAELKGAAHAREDLFEGATVILTPHAEAEADAVARVRALWEVVGGNVCTMEPETHDEVLARTSHVPHLLATLLTCLVEPLSTEQRAVIGPGFLDTTRVAAGDPEMWRDICLTNADALLALWPDLEARLGTLRRLVDARDAGALLRYFTEVRDLREALGPNTGGLTE